MILPDSFMRRNNYSWQITREQEVKSTGKQESRKYVVFTSPKSLPKIVGLSVEIFLIIFQSAKLNSFTEWKKKKQCDGCDQADEKIVYIYIQWYLSLGAFLIIMDWKFVSRLFWLGKPGFTCWKWVARTTRRIYKQNIFSMEHTNTLWRTK